MQGYTFYDDENSCYDVIVYASATADENVRVSIANDLRDSESRNAEMRKF